MKRILEDLWYSYQMENAVKFGKEEKEMAKKISIAEDALQKSLNDEQKVALKIYEDCLDEISDACEKKAFVKGIRFAVGFLLEALYL